MCSLCLDVAMCWSGVSFVRYVVLSQAFLGYGVDWELFDLTAQICNRSYGPVRF